jgi:hypothetical protein
MQLRDRWGTEYPDLRALLPGGAFMLGEDWYDQSLFSADRTTHQYRAIRATDRRAPFAALEQMATAARVRTERRGGKLELVGEGWTGVARVLTHELNGEELARGHCIELVARAAAESAQAQAMAKALCREHEAFAPFVGLAEREGAVFTAACRFEFEGPVFGYFAVEREGLGQFLSSHLADWLRATGFMPVGEKLWQLGAHAVSVSPAPTRDQLRVDVPGLMEHHERLARTRRN